MTLRRLTLAATMGCAAAFGVVAMRVAYVMVLPPIERTLLPPVERLDLDGFRCRGGDLLASGDLVKRTYPNGNAATLLGLTVMTAEPPWTRLPWTAAVPDDRSPASRPGGPQRVDLLIRGACGVAFVVKAEHVSPLTGLRIPSTFGPFDPRP